MTDCDTFAEALRRLWQDSGLRQDEFARALGYQRPTVANMLRGSHLPPLDFLTRADTAFPGSGAILEPLLVHARRTRAHEKAEHARGRTRLEAPDGNGRDDDMALFGRRREPSVDLTGTWYAIWETAIEGEPLISTETLRVTQSGTAVTLENEDVSPENPIGGYLWRGDCTFHDNAYLMGTYQALDPNRRQRGTLFYTLHRAGQFLLGRWVGCSYDSDLLDGLTVLARDREEARVRFDKAYGQEVLPPATARNATEGSA